MRNRTRTTLAAVTIAGLALTGCTAPEAEVEPTPTIEQTTPAPEPETVPVPIEPEQAPDESTYDPGAPVVDPPMPDPEVEQYELTETDRLYLLDVRLQVPGHVEADEDLIAAAFLVCLAYEINRDMGVPDDETRAELMTGLTGDEAQLMAAVDAAATHHYCPAGGAS